MVEIVSFNNKYYSPPDFEGLDKIVLFPDGEYKREKIPNSSVWLFKANYPYNAEILADDVGCGMAAFVLQEMDPKEMANKFCKYLRGKNILGSTNLRKRKQSHFVTSLVSSNPHITRGTASATPPLIVFLFRIHHTVFCSPRDVNKRTQS